MRSPKDTFITVYGRKPVLEALDDADLHVDKVVLADDARGEPVRAIIAAARARDVPVQRASAHRVKVLAGNGRHDQGVLADVVAPRMQPVDEFLLDLGNDPGSVLVLDRVTNPANVGMVLRSATAAGLDGVLLPRRGVPAIDPLVVKASAGVAFRAPVLRAATAEEGCAALRGGGFAVFGLDSHGASLLDADLPRRVALVLGNETDGLSDAVRAECDGTLAIPMQGGVESLNVASAAAVAAFELFRRRRRPVATPSDDPGAARSSAGVHRGGMGIGDFVNKAKGLADEHDEQVDQGLDRAGDMAKERFAGHEDQVDSVVDRAQQYTGEGDTTVVAPAGGGEPAQEVPGGPQNEVPAGPGEVPPQQ